MGFLRWKPSHLEHKTINGSTFFVNYLRSKSNQGSEIWYHRCYYLSKEDQQFGFWYWGHKIQKCRFKGWHFPINFLVSMKNQRFKFYTMAVLEILKISNCSYHTFRSHNLKRDEKDDQEMRHVESAMHMLSTCFILKNRLQLCMF